MFEANENKIKNWTEGRNIAKLFAALIDERGKIRKLALEALESIGWHPETPGQNVRYYIARDEFDKCLQFGDEAIEPLAKVLIDDDVNEAVAKTISKIGKSAVDKLMQEITFRVSMATATTDDKDFKKEWNKAILVGEGLVQIGEPALDALLKAMKKPLVGGNEAIRSVVAVILGAIGDRRATMLLIEALNEKATFIGGIASSATLDGGYEYRKAALNIGAATGLGLLGDEKAVLPLINVLRRFDIYVKGDLDNQVVQALFLIGEPSVSPLIDALNDKHIVLRESAITVLGQMKEKRALDPIIAIMKNDKEASVRHAAVKALEEYEDKAAINAIIDALNDDAPIVKVAVIKIMGRKKIETAVTPLIQLLDDKNEDVKIAAILALGKIGDKKTIQPLINLLKQKYGILSQDIPEKCGTALGMICDVENTNEIIDLLSHEYVWTRTSAAKILGKIGDTKAVDPLIQGLNKIDMKGRFVFADALGKIGDSKAIEPLIQALKDKDGDVRQSSAKALGLLKATQAIQALIEAFGVEKGLLKGDFQKTVRTALKKIDTPEAKKASEELKAKQSKCFIATAVYGNGEAPEVMVLRKFRDDVLLKSFLGKIMVEIYYFTSPKIAEFLRNTKLLKSIIRNILDKIVAWVKTN